MSRMKTLSLKELNQIIYYVENDYIHLKGNEYFQLVERRYELEEIHNVVEIYDLNFFRYKRERGSIKIYRKDSEELVESYSCYYFYSVETLDELRIIKRSDSNEMV